MKFRLLCSILTLLFVHSFVEGAEWKYFTRTDFGEHFYNAEDLTHPAEDIVQVWVKLVYSKQGVEAAKIQKYDKQYKAIDHSLISYEIHCKLKRFRLLEKIDYSKKRIINKRDNRDKAEWSSIPLKTAVYKLSQEICFERTTE